jgi:hypothetical protein
VFLHLARPSCCRKTMAIQSLHKLDVKPLSTQTERRTKTAQVNLRLLPEMKDAAERAAADDRRSLTSLIEKLLGDYLEAAGYLAKGDAKH